jgi:ABC-2 type transport system permease protein
MIRDIRTVTVKELKEIFSIVLGHGHLVSSLVMVGIFGFFLPYQEGDFFLKQTSASLSLYIFLVPLIVCSGLVADSFAGERERKTLESLLATRLPDFAIFTGKILAVLIYSYIFVSVIILSSVAGANLYIYRAGRDAWFFYTPISLFALFVFTIPVLLTGTAIGVFFSLKCSELRTAYVYSRMGWLILTLPLISGWVKFRINWHFLIPAFYIVTIAGIILLILGTRFFRRSELI